MLRPISKVRLRNFGRYDTVILCFFVLTSSYNLAPQTCQPPKSQKSEHLDARKPRWYHQPYEVTGDPQPRQRLKSRTKKTPRRVTVWRKKRPTPTSRGQKPWQARKPKHRTEPNRGGWFSFWFLFLSLLSERRG